MLYDRIAARCIAPALLLLVALTGGARTLQAQGARVEGTALVSVGADEYKIVIECDEGANAAAGFSTQPNRITRERRGRSNGVNARLRTWKDTDEMVLSVDRYVAWLAPLAPVSDTLRLRVAMSSNASTGSSGPVLMTFERWKAGERFDPQREVEIKAWCSADPTAPSYRKVAPR